MQAEATAKRSFSISFRRNILGLAYGLLFTTFLIDSSNRSNAEQKNGGTDWPVFLGPKGYGQSEETGILKKWPAAGLPLVWEKAIGTGYSAPAVLGNRLVVHHRQGEEELVQCLSADTGEEIWLTKNDSRFSDPYGYNNGPRCSPLLTTEYCFTLGAEGLLQCLKMGNGEVVWRRELRNEYSIPDAFFGVGATPVLEGNKLLVLVGGQPNAGVVAFEAKTGQPLWAAVGKATWDGEKTGWPAPETYSWTGDEMVVSYSSPIVETIHGRRHLLCLMRQGLVSLDPETGAENFHYWFRSRDHESVNAARPVVLGNRIFLSAAYRVGSVLLEVQADGKAVQEVWRNPRNLSAHWSTPIPLGDYIYGFDGRHENEGSLRCLEIETGRVVWETTGWEKPVEQFRSYSRSTVLNTETGQEEPWPYYGRGSAILVDGHFIVLGERGTLALVKASETGFEEISRFKPSRIGYPSWAAPVLSRGLLYLRAEEGLVCYRICASN